MTFFNSIRVLSGIHKNASRVIPRVSHKASLNARNFLFLPTVSNMAVGKNKRLTKGGKKGAKKKV